VNGLENFTKLTELYLYDNHIKDIEVLENKPLSFQCTCSAIRIEKTLLLLGKNEIQQLIETQHGAEITCNFCNQRYQLQEDDLNRLLIELSTN
jgi:molecular chaperone Hsp33